jgi:DNA-binding LytR/AlgR family response regulator
VRVHRSAIVAVDRIASISAERSAYVIELKGGIRLRSSRQYVDRVRELLR